MSQSDADAKALRDVEAFGCHVLLISGDEDGPNFCYSIGIEATSQQPDLLILGMRSETAHWIINEYNERVRAGEVFVPNLPYYGFIEGFPVFFSLLGREHYEKYLGWGRWFYGGNTFRAYQMIYPTTSGLWPWSKGAPEGYLWAMPLLCPPPSPLPIGQV